MSRARAVAGVVIALTVAVLVGASPVLAQTDTREAVTKADRAVAAYQLEEARTVLEPLKEKLGADAAVAMALGRLLEQDGKGNEATSSFKKAIELAQAAVVANPEDALAFYSMGVAQQRLKQLDKAAESLERARTLGFDQTLVSFQLGATRAFQQRWAEAVEQLSAALEKDDGLAYAYYYRGLAQEKLGKKDQLVIDMERFLKLAPKAPEATKAQAIVKSARR